MSRCITTTFNIVIKVLKIRYVFFWNYTIVLILFHKTTYTLVANNGNKDHVHPRGPWQLYLDPFSFHTTHTYIVIFNFFEKDLCHELNLIFYGAVEIPF